MLMLLLAVLMQVPRPPWCATFVKPPSLVSGIDTQGGIIVLTAPLKVAQHQVLVLASQSALSVLPLYQVPGIYLPPGMAVQLFSTPPQGRKQQATVKGRDTQLLQLVKEWKKLNFLAGNVIKMCPP